MSRRADVVKVGMDALDFIAADNHSIGVRGLLDGRANVVPHTDGSRIVHVHSAAGEFEVPVRRVRGRADAVVRLPSVLFQCRQRTGPRAWSFTSTFRAPVMIATTSVMLTLCGVITAARRPSRCTWMRSATSNT